MKTQILARTLICSFVAWMATQEAKAFVGYETSPGTVEIRARNDWGLQVTRVQMRKAKGKTWTYFCVSDMTFKVPAKHSEKCFYGNPQTFLNVKVGARFRSIEYGLKNRVYNNRGYIAIGAERYFYPVYVLYDMK